MRLLFTGDWQLDATNLHQAKKMVKEIFFLCKKWKIDAVINLGDVKHRYSPIDGKVLNFAVRVCSKFKAEGIPYYVLLGNHDRYGMWTDTSSWLPVLKKAGAKTFDSAGIDTFDDGTQLFFLPFRSSISETKHLAEGLASQVTNPSKSILLFHQDLRSCSYDVTRSSDSKLRPRDLFPDKYLYCIGGHIHLQQCVKDNIWYAGSPFPMDWGEVNQRKGYLFVDTNGVAKIKRIESSIPRFYDPLLPNFEQSKPTDWTGATVRVRVPVWKSDDYQKKVEEVKTMLEESCPGAHILAMPKFDNSAPEDNVIDLDATDVEKIKRYVDKTCPQELVNEKEKIIAYLVYRIQQDHIVLRQKQKIIFGVGYGKNFLSYKDVSIDFGRPGITLVTSENKDWPRRSNGGGKTNLLQIPAVAFCGSTFKDQKCDAWVRRKSDGIAEVGQNFTLQDGRKCLVTRGRPHKLKLEIEGVDESRDNKKKTDQDEIARLTGFTWEVLAAAIYVDQNISNSLLRGTDAERKKLLAQIQNSERFAVALKRVGEDRRLLEDLSDENKHRIELLETLRGSFIERLEAARQATGHSTDRKRLKRALKEKSDTLKELDRSENLTERVSILEQSLGPIRFMIGNLYKDYNLVLGEIREAAVRLRRLTGLGKDCPTCEQPVDKKKIATIKAELVEQKRELRTKAAQVKKKHEKTEQEWSAISGQVEALKVKSESTTLLRAQLTNDIDNIKKALEQFGKQETEITRLEARKREIGREIKIHKKIIAHCRREWVLLTYCNNVFSRNGLPAFLNSYLCPQLNTVAEYYSDLLSDGVIKVRFDSEEGSFVPRVINTNGGEEILDQSRGESQIASLITSFAARDVLAPTNLLILDEPGEGLDAANASWFARKLRDLGPKLGTVLITSHNPNIISELEGCYRIHIVKKNGVSYCRS